MYPFSCQIARYLPHHRSENASKTHPKSSHDKFKTASKKTILRNRLNPQGGSPEIRWEWFALFLAYNCIAGTISNRHAVRLVIVTLYDY